MHRNQRYLVPPDLSLVGAKSAKMGGVASKTKMAMTFAGYDNGAPAVEQEVTSAVKMIVVKKEKLFRLAADITAENCGTGFLSFRINGRYGALTVRPSKI
jgi:hypothetical protein